MNVWSKLGIGISIVTSIGLAGISTPASAEPMGPEADLTVTNPNYTTVPTIFSAMNSGVDGDFRGYTFEFDPDGDGIYDPKTEQPFTEFIFDQPGNYTASVRVSDEYGRTTVATADVVIADVLDLGNPFVPAEGQSTEVIATLDKKHVAQGGRLKLDVSDLNDGEQFGAGLTPESGENEIEIWFAPSVKSFGPFVDGAQSIEIPADAKPGKYQVLITTDSMRRAAIPVIVDAPDEAGSATDSEQASAVSGIVSNPVVLVSSGVGLIALLAAAAGFILIRKRGVKKPIASAANGKVSGNEA